MALIGAAWFSALQAERARLEAQKATAIKDLLIGIFVTADAVEPHLAEPQELRLVDVIGDIYELVDSMDRALELYQAALPIAARVYGPDGQQHARLLASCATWGVRRTDRRGGTGRSAQ